MNRRQVDNSSFKRREVHPAAEDVQKKQVLVFDAPGCAHAEIGKLGIFVCGIPALEDLVESPRLFARTVEFQPFAFDYEARQGLWILLVLRGKIVIRHRTTLAVERGRSQERRLQDFSDLDRQRAVAA